MPGAHQENIVRVSILTVSDRCSSGACLDESGPILKKVVGTSLQSVYSEVVVSSCIVPDEQDQILDVLRCLIEEKYHLVITTGGTGLSPRDVTPQAVAQLMDKRLNGMEVALLVGSLQFTPMAMLSRPVCGIARGTLIVTFPGSRTAVEECWSIIDRCIPHALDLINDCLVRVNHHHHNHGPGQVEKDTSTSQRNKHGPACKHYEGAVPTADGSPGLAGFIGRICHRPRISPYPMISMEQALDMVNRESVPSGEGVPMEVCIANAYLLLGCVLKEDVRALYTIPELPTSIKDGYAVIADDPSTEKHVTMAITAGQCANTKICPGTCVRVSTGSTIPPGATAVVQVEDTVLVSASEQGEELVVQIKEAVPAGTDIRAPGFDVSLGEVVLEMGSILGPAELGLLASVGVREVVVYRKVITALMSTGNEVVDVSQDKKPHQVFDSNRIALAAQLQKQGFPFLDLGIIPDSHQALQAAILDAAAKADVIVTTGGVSMGELDLLKTVVEQRLGGTIHFGRINMKPGKPTTFATFTTVEGIKKLIFCLPGNPVSAIVTFHLFVLRALRHLSGERNFAPVLVKAEIAFDVELDSRPEYHRSVLVWTGQRSCPQAFSTGNQCSSRLLSCRSANALLVLPGRTADLPSIRAGALVDALLYL